MKRQTLSVGFGMLSRDVARVIRAAGMTAEIPAGCLPAKPIFRKRQIPTEFGMPSCR